MQIRWTQTALRDLQALHEYIAADNPSAATETVDSILIGIELLARHPEIGRKGRIRGTREMIAAPFIVAYRIRKTTVEILAIIHGARKWPDSF